jgi:hypothetical protein
VLPNGATFSHQPNATNVAAGGAPLVPSLTASVSVPMTIEEEDQILLALVLDLFFH